MIDNSLAAEFTRMDEEIAMQVARQQWGFVAASVRRLDTERDDTFLLTNRDHRRVLKVAHPLDDPEVIDLQSSAIAFAGAADESLPLPRLVPSVDGTVVAPVIGVRGEPRLARLLTYLSGSELQYDLTSAEQRSAIGVTQGRLSLAMEGFDHPAAERYLHFDLKQLGTIRSLLDQVTDPVSRDDVERVLDNHDAYIEDALAATRQQVVHHDINADNVLVDYELDAFVTGILDFGDVVHSSVVGDLGTSMAYAVDAGVGELADPGDIDPWSGPYDLAAGFESVRTLTDDERTLLPDLVMARLAQRLLLNSWLAASDPSNAHYTGKTIARSARALHRLLNNPAPSTPGP